MHFVIFIILISFSPLSYAVDVVPALDFIQMGIKLLAGLALFLYGMDLMIKGLLIVAGDKMKSLLKKLTTNRITGALTGAGVTAVIQSSSVTSVLVVGFVSAGLMSVSQAAGVIIGANLGTTITAQMIAFQVTNWAYVMVFIGFLMQFILQTNFYKNIGKLIFGLGLIFLGMNLMSDAMHPLRDYQPFLDIMKEMEKPLLAILIGATFTALVQSSSATTGIAIVMASSGFLTLPAGIALILGANIGTCVTALLAAIGKSRDALRAALIHVQFNVLGALIWLPFIADLAIFSTWLSTGETNVIVLEGVIADNSRELANANTLFNLINLILFLPLIPVFLWVVNKIVPILPEENISKEIKLKFLDKALIKSPSMALDSVRMEIDNYRKELNKLTHHLIKDSNSIAYKNLLLENHNLKRLKNYHTKILKYVGKISQSEMSEKTQEQYICLVSIMNSLQSILDTIDKNILQTKQKLLNNGITPSNTMNETMQDLAKHVFKSIDKALTSVNEEKHEESKYVFATESTINSLFQETLKHQAKQFSSSSKRLLIFKLEMRIIEGLKRLHSLSKEIARLNSKI